jgi:hypothetical protein
MAGAADIAKAGKLHDELKAHDAKRQEIIAQHLGG